MNGETPVYQFDNVRVEPQAFRMWKDGRAVQIEPKAFEVLLYLIRNRGRLVEKREFLDAVWKESYVTENALTREIAQLRKALGEDARHARYIETVPTRGYRFIAEVRDADDEKSEAEIAAELRADALPEPVAQEPPTPAQPSPLVPPAIAPEAENVPEKLPGRRLSARVLAALAVVALVATCALIWRYTKKSDTVGATGVQRLTQVTTSVGLDFYPSLSPDGSAVAYSSDRSGDFEIYVKQLASGGREIQITSDGQQNFQPAWSPDGQFIAYHSRQRGGIWLVPALGGVARRLTEFGSKPAWSPDSSRIAFQSATLTDLAGAALGALPPSTIWTVQARGGELKQITQVGTPSGGHGSPVWTPNGQRISFFALDTALSEVWSVSAQGTDLKRLVPNQPFYDCVYAPNGEYGYCAGTLRGEGFGLWKVRISPDGEPLGNAVKVEGTGSTPIRYLSMSADGRRIAYSTQSQKSDIWAVPVAPATAEAAGAPVPLFEDTSRRKTNPAFSPDGRRVAFGVYRLGASAQIWLMDPDGKNQTQLTTHLAGSGLPSWVAGSDRLAFVTYREDELALWTIDLRTGTERRLADLDDGLDYPRLSPDARRLASNSRRSGTINVWTRTVDGGEEARQLTFDREMAGFPAWSPDGKFIAYEIKRGDDTHIAVIPSEGGEPRQLTFDRGESWPHSWSPDSTRIAFAGFRNGYWNIWWVSRVDGTERQLTNNTKPNAYVRYPAWSPLGDRIVYEYAEMTGNIWMMDLK